jgi:hypothetical protein
MGREYSASWQADPDGHLVLAGPNEEWAFGPHGDDRWLGRNGEQAGEILTVLRDQTGAVVGLDIATFVFRRAPMED